MVHDSPGSGSAIGQPVPPSGGAPVQVHIMSTQLHELLP
jgi:hypothetical protein